MIKFPEKPTVFFDVDNTIVFSPAEFPDLYIKLSTIGYGGRDWLIHREHINLLKDFHARGHTVIVWSAGGADWAEGIITALQLTDYVYACMPKPFWYADDKKCHEFMDDTKHIYINKSYLDRK